MSLPRYPKYKDSGVEWLGEVPGHWNVTRLKNIASINMGQSPSSDDCTPEEIGLPFLQGNADFGEHCPLPRSYCAVANKLAKVNDILFSVRAPVGAINIADQSYGIGRGLCAITAKSEHSMRFVFHALQVMKSELFAVATGSTYEAVSTDQVGNAICFTPTLPEQTQIATFLDRETAKIDELVTEQRRLMELLKEKRQAVISHAVTRGLNPDAPLKPSGIEWLGDVPEHWRVGKCGFYLSILSGFAFPSTGFSTNESDTRLLRGINVGVTRLKWEEVVYWKRSTEDALEDYEMQAGDLVIGMDRPLISEGMRVAKVKDSDLPCLLLQRVASLKPGPPLNSDYLLHLLSSEMFVAHFSPDTTGVSVPHISPDQINNFVIPVPPISEQSKIVEFVANELAKFDTLTTEAQRAIDLLQERRTALISAAVTGQIDVRGAVVV